MVNTRWSYERDRLEDGESPADVFRQARPNDVTHEDITDYSDDAPREEQPNSPAIRYIARIRCKGVPGGVRIALRARYLDAREREIARGVRCVDTNYCQSNTLHQNNFDIHTQRFYLEFKSRQVSPDSPWVSSGRPQKGCKGYGTRV